MERIKGLWDKNLSDNIVDSIYMNLSEAVSHYFELKKHNAHYFGMTKKIAKYFSRIIRLLYLKQN